VRLYSGNAHDWTARAAAITADAELIKAKTFTIGGEGLCFGLTASHGSTSGLLDRPLET
jgi:ATP-dependent DNA ligase